MYGVNNSSVEQQAFLTPAAALSTILNNPAAGTYNIVCSSSSSCSPTTATGSASTVTVVSTSGSPYTMTGQTGFYWNNSSGAFTWQLNIPVANVQYCYANYPGKTSALTIKSTTGVYISYKGVIGTVTTGTLVSSGAAGDAICLVGIDSTHYAAMGAGYGTWTNN
jgi:hypothetical protein